MVSDDFMLLKKAKAKGDRQSFRLQKGLILLVERRVEERQKEQRRTTFYELFSYSITDLMVVIILESST